MDSEERRALEESFIREANKRWGAGTLVRASSLRNQTFPRVTTGSLSFDIMLGGGWPLNQWNEIIGMESCGKTVIALKTIAANQKANPEYEVLWVASEDFVEGWAEQLGVDLSRVTLAPTNEMEKAYQLVIDALENRQMDAVVIDSLPALVPSDEAEKSMQEFAVGLGARLTGKFMRKSTKTQKRDLINDDRDCLAIIINQWREKIGITYGDPRTTPGGKAKDFHYFTRVEVARDAWIEVGEGKSKFPIGLTIKARTKKNKTAPPQRVAMVDFYFAPGGLPVGSYDLVKEVFTLAVANDIVEQKGAFYTYNDAKWRGKESVLDSLREEPELFEHLYKELRGVYGI